MTTATLFPSHRARFAERTASTASRVDRDSGVIHGVKLIGRRSLNGREYTTDALLNARPKYEGVKVFVDHPRRGEIDEDRRFGDWVGIVRNVQLRDGGLFGDVHLRRSSPFFEEICEAAEKFAHCFGCSHVATGASRTIGGVEVVEEIDSIESVDLVLHPATTAGLFESLRETVLRRGPGDKFMPPSATQVLAESYLRASGRLTEAKADRKSVADANGEWSRDDFRRWCGLPASSDGASMRESAVDFPRDPKQFAAGIR